LLLGAFIEDFLAQSGVCVLDVLSKTIWRLGDDLE